MSNNTIYDIVVIGSGPAGQKAAIQGAKAGKRVALIEQNREVGGSCVYQGTIPSKTLRESALQIVRFQRTTEIFEFKMRDDVKIASLMKRLDHVVKAHGAFMKEQIGRNNIDRFHGRASFVSDREVLMQGIDGKPVTLTADIVTARRSPHRISQSLLVRSTRHLTFQGSCKCPWGCFLD